LTALKILNSFYIGLEPAAHISTTGSCRIVLHLTVGPGYPNDSNLLRPTVIPWVTLTLTGLKMCRGRTSPRKNAYHSYRIIDGCAAYRLVTYQCDIFSNEARKSTLLLAADQTPQMLSTICYCQLKISLVIRRWIDWLEIWLNKT